MFAMQKDVLIELTRENHVKYNFTKRRISISKINLGNWNMFYKSRKNIKCQHSTTQTNKYKDLV